MIRSPIPRVFAEDLLHSRKSYVCILPPRSEVHSFAAQILEILFPHFTEKRYDAAEEISLDFAKADITLRRILKPLASRLPESVDNAAERFFEQIPEVHRRLCLDAKAIFEGDPAARSIDEVILAYPGFYAIAIYRIAHVFQTLGVPVFPRVLTEFAHKETGIDIHPGATIGDSFCIDHGTGIVIGETTVIGDNVKLYQGVTLGALSVEKDMADTKRHPTIEDHVVIYAQATILGGKTTIGHHSVIGGNVWLTESVPPNSTVYHKTEIKIKNSDGVKEQG
jgi:serine O-acetyltransferase